MLFTFARSAARHGISQERAVYVIEHCPIPLQSLDDSDLRDVLFFLGFDAKGVPLEVAALERDPDELMIIHAMPLRKRLISDFEWVMRWHER